MSDVGFFVTLRQFACTAPGAGTQVDRFLNVDRNKIKAFERALGDFTLQEIVGIVGCGSFVEARPHYGLVDLIESVLFHRLRVAQRLSRRQSFLYNPLDHRA